MSARAGGTDEQAATDERQRLGESIMATLESGVGGDQSVFDELAPKVFAYQYANNLPYRQFCDAKGVQPETATNWREIPVFPTDAFKTHLVASFPLEEAVFANITSGTTSPGQRGAVYRDELGRELTFLSNRLMTAAYLFPDFEAGQRCRVLLLAPSPAMAPSMGMALGMEATRKHFGTDDSRFLLGRTGVDVTGLVSALREAEECGTPVALVGTTSAFVYFFKACERKNMYFRLPVGSRIADGGGYRGRFGEVTRDDYYRKVVETLGVPPNHCVNTLGMAETGTNFFDSCLRDFVTGTSKGLRHKVPPPWTRVTAVSLDDLSPLPHGQVGLLRHYDLTCLPTVMGVQTDNLGFTDAAGGFEIVGRAKLIHGKVSRQPDVRPVGPMGSRPIFRLLERYVNFSINVKMGRFAKRERAGPLGELEAAGPGAVPSCPSVVDDLIAAAHDPVAAERAEAALRAFSDVSKLDAACERAENDEKNA